MRRQRHASVLWEILAGTLIRCVTRCRAHIELPALFDRCVMRMALQQARLPASMQLIESRRTACPAYAIGAMGLRRRGGRAPRGSL